MPSTYETLLSAAIMPSRPRTATFSPSPFACGFAMKKNSFDDELLALTKVFHHRIAHRGGTEHDAAWRLDIATAVARFQDCFHGGFHGGGFALEPERPPQ